MRRDSDPKRISTSYVERNNLSMRLGMRCAGAHALPTTSQKRWNRAAAISLHYTFYNFARPHMTIRGRGIPHADHPGHGHWVTDLTSVRVGDRCTARLIDMSRKWGWTGLQEGKLVFEPPDRGTPVSRP